MPAWINNVQRVMPKGEVVPVPILCSVTFGAPHGSWSAGEDRGAFLTARAQAVIALRESLMSSFLRNLTPIQQVGLLFVMVFGLLIARQHRGAGASRCATTATNDDPHARTSGSSTSLLSTSWLMCMVFWIGWASGETVATAAVRAWWRFSRCANSSRCRRPAAATTAAWCWRFLWCCRCSSGW